MLSGKELMDTFGEFVAWENYVEEDLVAAEVEELRAATNLKLVEERGIASSAAKQVAQQKAEARSTDEWAQAYDRWLNVETLKRVLRVQQASLQRTAAFISRELTRRTGMHDITSRQARGNP